MTTEDQSAASDVSEQTAPQGEVEQTQSQGTSLADSLLQVAIAEGHDVGDVTQKPADTTPAATEAISDDSETETEDVAPAEGEDVQDDKPAVTSKKSIPEQIAEYEKKGEKPPWYLTRIAEESDKRRRKDSELETVRGDLAAARNEAQQLQAQLNQASAPKPTPQSPLADVYDEPSLQRLEQSYEKILEFAETNRDGATGVVVGRKDGQEILQDFSPEEISQLRYKADKALRKDIPFRRQFLVARAQLDSKAEEIYPELKDPGSPMAQEASAVLKQNPMLSEIVGPEVLVWIGHALKGREAFLKRNGNGNGTHATSATTQQIVKSAATKIAPTQPKTRSTFERKSGADLTQLNKELEENGDEQTAEKWLQAKFSSRAGAKAVKAIGA